MHVVEDHKAKTFIISETDGCKRVVDGQEINFLAVKLVNLAEIEDLEIDLVDKKVYQLIDDANKAEYYYDSAKNQCF